MSRVSPVLVGRVSELATLDAVSEQARRGAGGTVFLAGPAGIGKTRLASAAAARHTDAGGRVIRRRAGPSGRLFRATERVRRAWPFSGAKGVTQSPLLLSDPMS
jgi:hypothetical protein